MELVVLSGKGGTGKTTITSALIDLSKDTVCADCDVDAPNLSLIYKGNIIKQEDFYGGKKAVINEDKCLKCGQCENVCRFDALHDFNIDEILCEGCGACVLSCPNDAIKLIEARAADIELRKGEDVMISCAQMEAGADGSGKLITRLRRNAQEINNDNGLVIIDGSPGIGCPVISSITSSDYVLIVTEPTMSGIEDMKRVYSLCVDFGVKSMLCINKYDLNVETTKMIEKIAEDEGIPLVGKIPFDEIVSKSINELRKITEYVGCPADLEIRKMWINIKSELGRN